MLPLNNPCTTLLLSTGTILLGSLERTFPFFQGFSWLQLRRDPWKEGFKERLEETSSVSFPQIKHNLEGVSDSRHLSQCNFGLVRDRAVYGSWEGGGSFIFRQSLDLFCKRFPVYVCICRILIC